MLTKVVGERFIRVELAREGVLGGLICFRRTVCCRGPDFVLSCGRLCPDHDFTTRAAGFRGEASKSGEASREEGCAESQELDLGHEYAPPPAL